MKNLILVAVMLGAMVMSSGCATAFNHSRVKENIIKSRIVAQGNQTQIKALNAGVKPSDAVKIIPMGDNGAGLAFNLFDLEGVQGVINTFAEAPVSSTIALGVDGAATYFAVKAVSDSFGGNNNQKKETNINLNNNSETTVIISENNGNGNTVNPDVNADSQNTTGVE